MEYLLSRFCCAIHEKNVLSNQLESSIWRFHRSQRLFHQPMLDLGIAGGTEGLSGYGSNAGQDNSNEIVVFTSQFLFHKYCHKKLLVAICTYSPVSINPPVRFSNSWVAPIFLL